MEPQKARDLDLLDAVDAMARENCEGRVWRMVREGRAPEMGAPSQSRWCNGRFDILYTALERDGAIAEIHALLSAQPVFPSKMVWNCHELAVRSWQTLKIADEKRLAKLGVDMGGYQDRSYERTQAIADAAYFLGFDGLIAPSARWSCLNLMLFTERLAPDDIQIIGNGEAIDWTDWRKRHRK